MLEEADMRTFSIRPLLPLVGIGWMLAGLFRGPAATAAEVEQFTYHNDWSIPYSWGAQDYQGIATPGGRRTLGDTAHPGLDWDTAYPIAIPFIKVKSASCGASASMAAASIGVADTGANLSAGMVQ
jgi:hypothetical protein